MGGGEQGWPHEKAGIWGLYWVYPSPTGMLKPIFPFFYYKSHFWPPHLISESLQECFKTPI